MSISANSTPLLISLTLSISLLSGCANMQQYEQFGETAGATLGGIVIGVSTVFSAAVDSWKDVRLVHNNTRVRTPEQDQRLYGFAPATDRVFLKFNKGYASPNAISPKQRTTIYNDYSLSLPLSYDNQADITYEWVLRKDGQVLNQSQPVVQIKKAGGHQATQLIKIPRNAEPGTYVFEIKLSSGSIYDVNKVDFVVR